MHLLIFSFFVISTAITKKMFESKLVPARFDVFNAVVNKREENAYIVSTSGGVFKSSVAQPVEETDNTDNIAVEQVNVEQVNGEQVMLNSLNRSTLFRGMMLVYCVVNFNHYPNFILGW